LGADHLVDILVRDEYHSYWVGIDPGFTGALAIIARDGGKVEFYDMPVLILGKKKELNRPMLRDMMYPWHKGGAIVAIERAQAMPKQGVISVFNYAHGYGILMGMLSAFAIPHFIVPPSEWKKKMLAGLPRGKDTARFQAMNLFPSVAEHLNLKKHHGRAEALLLAEYCRLRSARLTMDNVLEECSL
jgi:crossover junction endodeoxyribonuclease RuvC